MLHYPYIGYTFVISPYFIHLTVLLLINLTHKPPPTQNLMIVHIMFLLLSTKTNLMVVIQTSLYKS